MVHFIKSRLMAVVLSFTLLVLGILGGVECQMRFITAMAESFGDAQY